MKKVVIAFLIVFVVFAAFIVKTLSDAGLFKTIRPRSEGICLRVAGLPGPEDITVHPRTGVILISSDDRRAALMGKPVQGAIYALDRKVKGAVPRKLTAGFSRDFHPHGLSLYGDGSGKAFLFTINHSETGHRVEIFEYASGVLIHRDSIAHPLMFSPNDLVAVGPRSFYVTNDHGFASRPWRMVEDFIPIRRSSVLYYDGKQMRVAAKGFGYANGINISADGKTLYLAATLDRAVHVFSRDAASGVLTPAYDIGLGTGPDNIERDASGNLYVACHPKMLAFLAHAKDKTKLSPSQILRITMKGKGQDKVEEIYMNDGKEISAASVAAPFKGGLVIGQVFDGHILVCTGKNAPVK